jgi:hypothetical protein
LVSYLEITGFEPDDYHAITYGICLALYMIFKYEFKTHPNEKTIYYPGKGRKHQLAKADLRLYLWLPFGNSLFYYFVAPRLREFIAPGRWAGSDDLCMRNIRPG